MARGIEVRNVPISRSEFRTYQKSINHVLDLPLTEDRYPLSYSIEDELREVLDYEKMIINTRYEIKSLLITFIGGHGRQRKSRSSEKDEFFEFPGEMLFI